MTKDNRPNFLIIMTDQQRGNLHFPIEWQNENLPGMKLLRETGLEFINGFCNACMCSPSRSTMMSSTYPAQHGVTDTLSFGGKYSITENVLSNTLPNIATALRPIYDPQYRGKWHLSKGGLNGVHTEKSLLACEVAVFGWKGWVAPDAGEDTKLANCGGGYVDHDSRYVSEAIAYLKDWKIRKAKDDDTKPFVMILSLVNPHDVLTYPRTYAQAGYTDQQWLEGPFVPPPSYDEQLINNFKPDCQWQLVVSAALGLGTIGTSKRANDYLNFYANLIKLNDDKICEVLAEFYELENGSLTNKALPLAEETIILRIADHGEMGLAHGGMRQKSFNCYEETLRIPYIYSNPKYINNSGKPKQTTAIASLIDVLPTLCGLADMPIPEGVRGYDLSDTIMDKDDKELRDSLLFTFDDIRSGATNTSSVVNAANRIRCVRTKHWKYARYFDENSSYLEEYEFYYLCGQGYDQNNIYPVTCSEEEMLRTLLMQYPLEFVNLAYSNNPLMKDWPDNVKQYVTDQKNIMQQLLEAEEHRLLLLSNVEIHQKAAKFKAIMNALDDVSEGSLIK